MHGMTSKSYLSSASSLGLPFSLSLCMAFFKCHWQYLPEWDLSTAKKKCSYSCHEWQSAHIQPKIFIEKEINRKSREKPTSII